MLTESLAFPAKSNCDLTDSCLKNSWLSTSYETHRCMLPACTVRWRSTSPSPADCKRSVRGAPSSGDDRNPTQTQSRGSCTAGC
jgi:hypothetical protein